MDPVTFFVTLGISLATSYVNYLLAPTPPDVQGQRLTDKGSQMNASYGQSRARAQGTVQIPANILQKSEIRETVHVQNEGKKKHEYTVTTYTYSVDLALGFGQGPCVRFLDLFADSKLIWSGSLDSQGNVRPFSQSSDIGTITFYYGTENQLPDPILEGLVGTGNQPAYRGEVYLVLGNLQLANFGNRIPVFKANICYTQGNDAHPYQEVVGSNVAGLVMDPSGRPFLYGWSGSGGITRINTISNTVEAVGTPPGYIVNWLDAPGNGKLYAAFESGGGEACVGVIDATTLTFEKIFDTPGTFSHSLIISGPEVVQSWYKNGKLTVLGHNAGTTVVYIRNSKVSDPDLARDPITDQWMFDYEDDGLLTTKSPCFQFPKGGHVFLDNDDVMWSVVGSTLCRIDESNTVSTINDRGVINVVGTTDYDMSSMYTSPSAVVFVSASNSLMILDGVRGGWVQIDLATRTETNFIAGGWSSSGSGWYTGLDNNYFVTHGDEAGDSSTAYFSKLSPGPTQQNSYKVSDWTGSQLGAIVYDYPTNSVFLVLDPGISGAGTVYRFYLDRASGAGVSLQTVVEWLHQLAGLTLGAVDATALSTETVQGLLLSDNQSVRDTLRMLTQAYIFDGFEEDSKVVYKWRDGSSVLTIPEDDLGASENFPSDEEAFPEDFANELDAPMRVEVQFYDASRNYDTNAQEAKRIQNPDPTMLVKSTLTLKLPIVMTPTKARQLADRVLWYSWASRLVYEFKTKWKYARLSPCDIITVQYKGKDYLMRVLQIDMGAIPILVIKAESHDPEVYISSVVGDSGQGYVDSPILAVVMTEFFALDTPLIKDSDSVTGFYGACCSYSSDWRGAVIEISSDLSTWKFLGTSNILSAWGSVVTPPGDWKETNAFDDVNSVEVKMIQGAAPSSRTKLDILNDNAGLLALIKFNGSVELINYTDAQASGDNYILSGLWRGRRGTEWNVSGHVAGEKIIFLSVPLRFLQSYSDRNKTQYIRATSTGQSTNDALVQAFSLDCNDSMPYAPCFIRGYRDSTGSWAIFWERRTRLNGDWQDGLEEVPLNEDAELYDVEICALDGTIKRTSTDVPIKYLAYSLADQVTDFGSQRDQFLVNIYQKSTVVGRGFKGSAVIDINGNYGAEPDLESILEQLFLVNGSGSVPTGNTLDAQTKNNTSAFKLYNKNNFPTNFQGTTWTDQSGTTATVDSTKTDDSYNPVTPGHTSDVDAHALIPAASSVPWYAHVTPWFGHSGHIPIGVNNNTDEWVENMVTSMERMGVSGAIFDWYGQGTFEDLVVQRLKSYLASRAGNTFKYAICFDKGIAGLSQSVLQSQIAYCQTNYFSDSNYIKVSTKPLLHFFGVEGAIGDAAMTAVRAATTGAAGYWMGRSSAANIAKSYYDGTYDWAHPFLSGVSGPDPYNLTDVDGFYSDISGYASKGCFAAMCPGFNGYLTRHVGWSKGKYIPRDNGKCWLQRASENNTKITTGNPGQIIAIMVVTWNDWEEGSQIESGIENSISVATPTISGSNINWSVSGGTGDETTIDHYVVWYTKDVTQTDPTLIGITSLGTVAAGTHTFSLLGKLSAGDYKLYVEAVGKGGIRNHMSAGVAYTA